MVNRMYEKNTEIERSQPPAGVRVYRASRNIMKNTLSDLNNHLFEQLERLNDEELCGEELETEIKRTEAMAKIGEQIIRNGELQFKAMQHMDEYGYERQKAVPDMLEVRGGREKCGNGQKK